MIQKIYKIMKSEALKYFSGSVLLLIVFWGGMLRKSFNADTISHMISSDADVLVNIGHGRFVIAGIDFLLLKFGLRTTTNLSITMLIALLIFALTMVILRYIFIKWEPQDLWNKIGFFLALSFFSLNVLFAEFLMFSEFCVYFAIAYFMATLGIFYYTKKKYMIAICCIWIAVSTYQFAVIFAAIFLVFYIYLEEKEVSIRCVLREMIAILVCIGMGGINLLTVKVLEWVGLIEEFGKSAGIGNLGVKLQKCITSFREFWEDCLGIFPNLWLPLLFTIAVWGMICKFGVRENKFRRLAFLLIINIVCCLLVYVIPLMQLDFFFPPRMAFCFCVIQGLLVVAGFVWIKPEMYKFLTLGCCIYVIIHMLFADFVVTNHFISNTLDKAYVNMVYQEILDYEEEQGTVVTAMSVVRDIDSPFSYDEVGYVSEQINERALGTLSVSLMESITGRKLLKVPMDETIYNQYFANKDWKYFNAEEQIVFKDNVVYWCVF